MTINWGNTTVLIKTSALVIGLIALGYVAVPAAEHASPQPKWATELAPTMSAMVPAHTNPALDSQLSMTASPGRDAREYERGRTDGPRECRPAAGIVTECTFN